MRMQTRAILAIAALITAMLACTWPGGEPTPEYVLPTPNMTLTALFSPQELIAPTSPPLMVITATPPPPDFLLAVTPSNTNTPAIPIATSTNTPSVTKRPGGFFEAAFLSEAPKLDGVWDEWTSQIYPCTAVTYGKNYWSGSSDLEASFRIGWDSKNLYIAAKVIDDRYVQNATSYDIYKGDSLEILLDVDLYGDYYSQLLNSDDHQVGISPGNPDVYGKREAYLWFPRSKEGSLSNVEIASVKEEGGYRVEAAIPWSVFGITPAAGQQYGFAFSVSDNDDPSQNIQHSMASSSAYRRLTNPTTWGVLTLGR